MTTTIRRCKCASEYQDEQYGPGMRVFNSTGKDKDSAAWAVCRRCDFRWPCQALRNDPDPMRFREMLRAEFRNRSNFDAEEESSE